MKNGGPLGTGEGERRKQYPGQPFAWGNILIHHPPLASFLAGDTCKLISSLCYLVRIIMLQIQQLLLYPHSAGMHRQRGVSQRRSGNRGIKKKLEKSTQEHPATVYPRREIRRERRTQRSSVRHVVLAFSADYSNV